MNTARAALPIPAPAEQPARRGVIGCLLLHRIEDTDRRPGLMLALLVAVILLASAVAPLVPQ